ncbi:hypothetical protein BGZ82_003569, partial [Podila clonocystis]
MLFQVHRSGVVIANPSTGTRYEMSSDEAIFTLAHWVKDSTLILAQNIGGVSSLLLVEFKRPSAQMEDQASTEFEVLARKTLSAEPTTFHCWQEMQSGSDISYYCSVGTLEPSVLVFHILGNTVHDVYSESLAQAGRESATIPHSICVLQNHEKHRKMLVGLRDGNIISYDWTMTSNTISGSVRSSRKMTNPRLFKLGVMPVKFIHSCQESISRALIVSDRLWQASYVHDFEVHPVLFDSEVSQACSFQTPDVEAGSPGSFVFIVDHHDMQLASLDKMEKASSEESPDQHVVAEFPLKTGEAVYSLAEWKIPRPGKSDAVYICVGTGQFSPTGSELSAAAPKTGRLVVLSIKQSKKQDRKNRKFELDLRWAMAMSAPVFAISPFMDMKLLISNGPMLKLLALELEKKT